MKNKIFMAARIILGLIFFVFGLNGFLNFIPAPPTMPEGAMAFMTGMMAAPYFFPVLKGTEVICGALLLSGFAAPLALVILAPITLQIFFFHSFLTPGLENVVMPVVMIALHVTAAMGYWSLYKPLFSRHK
ncbi:DoxX family membrane protein [Bdellovibrio bacteriovorus]|uniref:DoxX family membrane protein n=1 Tax=Bdellovibrio TaxID=958 RepID=UPI0035A98573